MTMPPSGPEYYSPPKQGQQGGRSESAGAAGGEAGSTSRTYTFQLPTPAPKPPVPKGPRAFSLTALWLGIAAFLTGWLPVVGTVLGVAAIVFGLIALAKKQPRGMALVGAIAGFMGAVVSGLALAHNQSNGGFFWSEPDYFRVAGY